MNSIIEQIKTQYKSGSMNIKLIMINVGTFLTALILSILFKLFSSDFNINDYLAVSSSFTELIKHPWTIITHMFAHSLNGIGHVFWNMVMLYWAGNYFQSLLGQRKLLSTYLLGGIAGFIFFYLGYNVFPSLTKFGVAHAIGASAAVTAILVAIGTYTPHKEFGIPFINVSFKLMHIVIFLVLLDFIRLNASIGLPGENTGGWLAHIGGATFGFIYASQLKKGHNINLWFEKLLDKLFTLFKPKPKIKVHKSKKVPRDDYSYNEMKVNNQAIIDRILDKISKSGYDSLSKKEKEILFRQSNNM